MPHLAQTLDRANRALRRSVTRVRRAPGDAGVAQSHLVWGDEAGRRRRGSSALDQSVAALQAAVWIASFVQAVFNEIRGRSDEL
jgi:hypothetical protein